MLEKIKLKRLHTDAKIPTQGTINSACFDFYAVETVTIKPNEVKLIECGWAFEIPEGYYVHLYPRSSLACKQQLIILNSPGVIDSDYRGPVLCFSKNIGHSIVTIKKGDRYAQMALRRVVETVFEEVAELNTTNRGIGGTGSTGK